MLSWNPLAPAAFEASTDEEFEFRRLGRGTDLLVTVEDLREAGTALEFLSGPITGLYDPGDRHGQGVILFGVLAALSGAERTYTWEKTLEGQESALRRGRTGGRPPSLDADQIEYALTLRTEGTPMKDPAEDRHHPGQAQGQAPQPAHPVPHARRSRRTGHGHMTTTVRPTCYATKINLTDTDCSVGPHGRTPHAGSLRSAERSAC
ncbi:hypothetical protein [Streptomyces sp. NPDC048295]|uniref:hypothetical protein n=1 Tax=Streptomyces sp. NPDC048295 TaxID=3154617 RepID=UPI00341F4715